MGGDVRTEAVGIAHGIFARRVLGRISPLLDVEELQQDLAVHILANLKYYRPDRGSLKTFVGMTFDQWWKQSIKERRTRQAEEESRWEMPDLEWRPARAADLELSDRGREIVARLPERTREVAVLHIAHGAPLKAVAEMTGVNYQTVCHRARRAKQELAAMA